MATVIDSLIVTLGLDPTNFTKGQKEAAQSFIKTGQAAEKAGKGIEESAKKASDFVSRLRSEALKLFAIFTGGKGLESFATYLNANNVALSRMGSLMGMSANQMAAFQGMARLTGTSGQALANDIRNTNNQLQQMSLTGDSAILPYLRALGISLTDANGKFRTANDLMPIYADKLSAIAKTDPARAARIGQGLGLSDDMISILIKGRKAYEDYLAQASKGLKITKSQEEASKALQSAWGNVSNKAETLGNILLERLTPALMKMLDAAEKVFDYLEKNPEIAEEAIAGLTGAAIVLGLAFIGVTGTAVLVAAAIGGIVAAALWLYNNWDTAVKWMGEQWDTFIRNLVTAWTNFENLFSGAVDSVKKEFSSIWEDASGAILNAGSSIMAAVKKVFGDALGWVTGKANAIWEKITGKKLFNSESDDIIAAQAAGSMGGSVGAVGGGMGAVTTGQAKTDKFQKGVEAMMAKGWTKEQSIGMMTNFDAESGLNEKSVGDGGQAYGIGQWHPDRQANFKKQFGKDIRESSYDEQIQFANWELNNTEAGAGRALRGATSSSRAAYEMSQKYERPAATAEAANNRAMMARAWEAKIKESDAVIEKINKSVPTGPEYGAPSAAEWGAGPTSNDNSSQSSKSISVGQVNINVPPGSDGKAIGDGFKESVLSDSAALHAEGGYI